MAHDEALPSSQTTFKVLIVIAHVSSHSSQLYVLTVNVYQTKRAFVNHYKRGMLCDIIMETIVCHNKRDQLITTVKRSC